MLPKGTILQMLPETMPDKDYTQIEQVVEQVESGDSGAETLPGTVARHDKEIAWQGKLLTWTFGFMVAILVVCVIAFVTFLLDAYRYHTESYNEYRKTLEEVRQEIKTDRLEKTGTPSATIK